MAEKNSEIIQITNIPAGFDMPSSALPGTARDLLGKSGRRGNKRAGLLNPQSMVKSA